MVPQDCWKKLDWWFCCLEDVYHQQRHTARASPSLALWKSMGRLDGTQCKHCWCYSGTSGAEPLLGSALPDLCVFNPQNYENNILKDIMVLMSFFWPDPLNSPNMSQLWVNFQWSVPAQSDTANHKAEREMLRLPKGASSSVQTTYMFCFVNSWKELEKDGKFHQKWKKTTEVFVCGLSVFKN